MLFGYWRTVWPVVSNHDVSTHTCVGWFECYIVRLHRYADMKDNNIFVLSHLAYFRLRLGLCSMSAFWRAVATLCRMAALCQFDCCICLVGDILPLHLFTAFARSYGWRM